jgi:hypothetical protein
VLARIIIGLGITIVLFAIAGRRFFWLSKLIRSGQPAPRRWQGLRKVSEAEVAEVAGQRKLLRWTVPGLAHFFTMWGFTVLLTTIVEAYGALFSRNFHIPLIGQDNWLAFVEDFFATAVLVSLVVFTIIRIKNAPSRKDRASRFYGSHLGAAWLVLFMISMVIVTLLLYRAAQIDTVVAGPVSVVRLPRRSGRTSLRRGRLLRRSWRVGWRHWASASTTSSKRCSCSPMSQSSRASWSSCRTRSTSISSSRRSTSASRVVRARSVGSTRPPTWTWNA